MTPDLEELLIQEFPDLFAQRALGIQGSCMAWGCTCGDGWWGIIDAFATVVTARANAERRLVELAQVKEKFGSLRIYLDGGTDFDCGAAWLADAMSTRICELTGLPGRLTVRGGYWQTLCPRMALELGAVSGESKGVRIIGKKIEQPASDPLDASLPTADHLRERYAGVLRGAADLPPGWMAIADALLSQIEAPAAVKLVSTEGEGLVVVVEGGNERIDGMIAMAQALALRTNWQTGAMPFPVVEA